MSANKNSKKLEIYKSADFRRELTFREKKVAEIKREKMRILADIKPVARNMITVDLSHARGNLDALKMCLRELEWKDYPFGRKDQHCDIHWHCTNFEQNPDLYGGKVNKFPGMCWICSKMNLFRVLDQMRALFPDEYDFYPRTWYLPDQLHTLAHDIRKLNEKRTKPRQTFIVKPDAGSQGEGIYLIRDVNDYIVNTGRTHVCQEYLSDVLLIDRYKFDLRVYAVLKSIEPLELYICKEGLARFSTVPYENPTNKNLHETYMHLTNYSLNKRSSTFNRSERDDEGSKRTLTSVFSRMKRYGYNTDKIWRRIERIIVKTIIAITPDLKVEMQATLPANKPGPSCFQILGFDVLLLSNLKPILLEINSSPSLRIDSEVEIAPGIMDYVPSPKDEEVKIPLIRDTLILVAPKGKLSYLKRLREENKKPLAFIHPSECAKKKKARDERRQRRREDEERRQLEYRLNRQPTQTEKNGMIHIETNHPRSRIVIIKSEDDTPPSQKKLNRESSFVLPNVHNVVTNKEEIDYFNKDANDAIEEIIDPLDHSNLQNDEIEKVDEMKDGNNNNKEADDSSEVTHYQSKNEEEEGDEDGDSEEDKSDPESWESSLVQLFPERYNEKFERLRLFEKLAEVFMICLGVRATQRLGPTGFRTFARKCRLNKKGLTNAAVDIMYIDVQRKWEHVNPERTTGLCFRGFLEACHEITRRKFSNGVNFLHAMEDFIDYCEENLQEEQAFQARHNPRLLMRRGRHFGYPHLEPMDNIVTSPLLDENGVPIDSRLRNYLKPKSAEDVDVFLRRHGQLEAIPYKTKSGRRAKSRQKHSED